MSGFPKDTLVVVIDGTQGTTYRNGADDGGLELRETGALEPTDLDDDGPAGSQPKEQSKAELDEATFAKQVANHLYKRAQRGDFRYLVLAADPQTLGQIRPSLHKEVTDRLIKEVAKTLTNSSIADVERSISAA